jgi:hypothetical protein
VPTVAQWMPPTLTTSRHSACPRAP